MWTDEIAPARRRPLRLWFWSIAAATMAVLVIGGVTRLTHSGLSIVNWQPLMGVLPPLDEGQWQEAFARYRAFPEYRQLRPEMTLAEFKGIFFWEYLHRLAARGVGLVCLVPFIVFALRGWLTRPLATRALALFALGALQGAMGWFMVKSGLADRPSVSHYRLAAHLSLAFLIFGAAVWTARDLAGTSRGAPGRTPPRVRPALYAVGALLALQVVWGAFVAGLKAGLVFNTFPLMGGRLVPAELLWLKPAVVNFVQNPIAVQWMHRVLGTVLLVTTVAFARRLPKTLVALVAVQYLLGVLTLLFYVPVALGVLHQATAMVIAGVWVASAHDLLHQPQERVDRLA